MQYLLKKLLEEKNILLFLSALGIIRAAHEISKFRINMTWIPVWDYPFNYKNIPLDSYHFYGGLFAVLMIIGFRSKLKISNLIVNTSTGLKQIGVNRWYETILIIGFEFLFYFYCFDVFYHVIFMKFAFMQFDYLVPFLTLFTR